MSPLLLLQYTLPALIVGALGGVLISGTFTDAPPAKKAKQGALSQTFLSYQTDDGALDYNRLARACLAAAERSGGHGSVAGPQPESRSVRKAKAQLDEIFSQSLEVKQWTSGAAQFAESLVQTLPSTDADEFEALLRASIERGDLEVQPGAWIPEEMN